MKLSKLFKDWRVLLMIIAVLISIYAIRPRVDTSGVMITSVSLPASNYIKEGSVLINLNGYTVNNLSDYNTALSYIREGDEVTITYIDASGSKSVTYPFMAVMKDEEVSIGLSVSTVPFSNIEFGLELSGGTRVILQPKTSVTLDELNNIMGILEQRLNVYGFKEIPINRVSDFSGNDYIKVELPSSVSVSNIQELLESEGVFEARIGNFTVFTGDDILSVCITGVDCSLGIRAVQGGFIFQFELAISEAGAQRFADKTNTLSSTGIAGETCYLNETIAFFLDGEFLEGSDLKISCNLKGVAERSPSISGGAPTREEAREDMRKLQSMLQSKNLPVGLNIESVEVISPKLGREFLHNIVYVFLLAIIGVDLVIALKYKSLKIALPIILVTLSEIIITLGVATLFSWTFDLAAIAGLIASIGTGVDDQIIITEEVLATDKKERLSFKQRIKNAFFIVFATFTTSIAIMVPLTQAGAGILKGFATTTIIAISVGVLITRPAYARLLEFLTNTD